MRLATAHMRFARHLERLAVLMVALIGDGEERLIHLHDALKLHSVGYGAQGVEYLMPPVESGVAVDSASLSALPDGQPKHHTADVALPYRQAPARPRYNGIGRNHEALLAVAAEVALGSVRLMPVANNMDASAKRTYATVGKAVDGGKLVDTRRDGLTVSEGKPRLVLLLVCEGRDHFDDVGNGSHATHP